MKHSILKIDQIQIIQTNEFMFRFNRVQLPQAFSIIILKWSLRSTLISPEERMIIEETLLAQTFVDSLSK